ncbi:XRE family transcriptional regulator [Geobacter sp.]|uniref:XRE family transcriptional regulator n=1 Tax=Geobacter sp. TaxID=46610 RepID=UPI002617168E|nr:XRE family transcriptional regulator [Geobacter sp.]
MIREFREQSGISQEELGKLAGVTRQTIAAWEKGERTPTLEQLARIAKALRVPLELFLGAPAATGPTLLFRADKSEAISAELRTLLARLAQDYSYVERLAGSLPILPESRPLDGYDFYTIERIAREIRDWLGVEDAPLGDVLSLLEGKGLKVILHSLPNEVSGFSAYTEELGAVIFVNAAHRTERQYFTALHELSHLIFHRREYQTTASKVVKNDPREKAANHLAGAVLLPRTLLEAELNSYRNRWIPEPLLLDLKLRYGVSMRTIIIRAEQMGIISKKVMGQQLGILDKKYGKENERGELPKPQTLSRLERLVYRTLLDEKITASRAAEILLKPLIEIRASLTEWLEEVPA